MLTNLTHVDDGENEAHVPYCHIRHNPLGYATLQKVHEEIELVSRSPSKGSCQAAPIPLHFAKFSRALYRVLN